MDALTADTDMAAQVVVDLLVRERTQENQQRKHRPQQLGSEDDGPIGEI